MRLSVLLIAFAVGVSPVNAVEQTTAREYPAPPVVEFARVQPDLPAIPKIAPVPPPPPPVSVPAEFAHWIRLAGQQCAGITPGLIAAQIFSESSFQVDAVSYSNALGPGQFIPETWARWGVDADRDGMIDPFAIADSVVALAAFMCDNVAKAQAGIDAGQLVGNPVDLALAAYNAGFGAVQHAGGMPSGGDYSAQTQPYVWKIRDLERSYTADLEARV